MEPLTFGTIGTGARAEALIAAAQANGWTMTRRSPADAEVHLDVVAVVDPTARSADEIVRQLEAGRHVVADPPWCRTLAEADRVIEASQRAGLAVMHAEYLAYAPVFSALLDALRELGPPRQLEAQFLAPAGTGATGATALVRRFAPTPLALMLLAARRAGLGVATGASLRSSDQTDDRIGTARIAVDFTGPARASVTVGTHRGTANVCDLQVASDSGVVRAEIFPTPHLERDGETVALPRPTADPPELEMFGHLDQLRSLYSAIRHGAAPITDAAFGRQILATVLDALGEPGVSPGGGPSR